MDDWLPVQGFPDYSVSRWGDVRRERSGRILRPHANQYGTVYVSLQRDWDKHQRSLALLVARSFLPSTTAMFDTPINLDGDRWNCAVENLMWRPRWFARRYNQQFKWPYAWSIETPIRLCGTGYLFSNSFVVAIRFGLLERDVVLSIANQTVTWPTYQRFELAE